MTQSNAPVSPPPPFVMLRGESIDLEPHHTTAPDGTQVGAVLVHIRNPIGAATVGMDIDHFDQFIENCQRVRASYTGIATPATPKIHLPRS